MPGIWAVAFVELKVNAEHGGRHTMQLLSTEIHSVERKKAKVEQVSLKE